VISSTTGTNGTNNNTGNVAAPNTAASNTAPGGTVWGGLTNISTSNNANASATNIAANGGTSQYLEIPFPNITIPTGNSISGITIGIERNASNTNSIRDNVIQLLKNNIAVGDNKANIGTYWPSSDATVTYGGTMDLWGTTWQASDFTNAKLQQI